MNLVPQYKIDFINNHISKHFIIYLYFSPKGHLNYFLIYLDSYFKYYCLKNYNHLNYIVLNNMYQTSFVFKNFINNFIKYLKLPNNFFY